MHRIILFTLFMSFGLGQGGNWTSQTSGTLSFLYSIQMLDANTGFAVGSGGTILKTTNGGSNWTSQTSPAQY